MTDETNVELAASVRDLGASMAVVAADSEALRTEMVAYRAAFESVDRRTARLTVAGVLAALVFVITMTTALVVSRSNAEVIESIKDCTSPPGACYEANQRRSNERLGPIIALICEAVPVDRRRPPCPPVT